MPNYFDYILVRIIRNKDVASYLKEFYYSELKIISLSKNSEKYAHRKKIYETRIQNLEKILED